MSTADPRRIVDTTTIGKEVIEMKKIKKHHSQLQNEKATGEILTIDGGPAWGSSNSAKKSFVQKNV